MITTPLVQHARRLGAHRSAEVPAATTLLVPVGSVEQHGPHLPLATDGLVAEAVCTALSDRRRTDPTASPSLLVAPLIPFGSSGEHEQFPGTVSIGQQALVDYLVELARSATRWCSSIRFISGHGGNAAALRSACRLLIFEGRDVAWTGVSIPGADAHAGHTETSLMLHLAPELVQMDLAAAGCTDPLSQILPALMRHGVHAVSANGVLGDPTAATAEQGEVYFSTLCDTVEALLRRGQPDAGGRLR